MLYYNTNIISSEAKYIVASHYRPWVTVGVHHIMLFILQVKVNNLPVFPHDGDRGQCSSFQEELVPQEAQNRDELLIDKKRSGRWKTVIESFLQHQMNR